ncbi:MAG: 2,3-bisphosphoglycerate-independent phosphoglycerate mutase [Candidatus Omnitrophota bacterium]|jgi:2,3-bisphosphoglycerate-independent phosphoglycerate mutase|nr:MAG: 2,3-bisphosphoglycerate-independent phosphoglycerate mutase [Candidatus Omnitrophota bacterium]
MDRFDLLKKLAEKNDEKIVYLIFDGVGDLSAGKGTPLEAAKCPHLDAIAARSTCGFAVPIAPGITPGSGPAHLSLFGYDPLKFDIGRGILSALGVNFDIKGGDVAARVNFATIDANGLVSDRRAGRIPTETCVKLCEKLNQIKLPGVEIFFQPEKEHRAAFILRGEGLSGLLSDTDPQATGKKPLPATPTSEDPKAKYTADLANQFIAKAFELLKDDAPANGLLLRGFDGYEQLPQMQEIYKLNPAAIAAYPMYKGVARLVGMDVLKTGDVPADEFVTLKEQWNNYDYFFVHIKKTDSYGEDGNFDAKVHVIEEVDALLPQLLELNPSVLLVTGDHSTPCPWKAHSFHPVPVMLCSQEARIDKVTEFNETACIAGGLGTMPMVDMMALCLAHAKKLAKYGA